MENERNRIRADEKGQVILERDNQLSRARMTNIILILYVSFNDVFLSNIFKISLQTWRLLIHGDWRIIICVWNMWTRIIISSISMWTVHVRNPKFWSIKTFKIASIWNFYLTNFEIHLYIPSIKIKLCE